MPPQTAPFNSRRVVIVGIVGVAFGMGAARWGLYSHPNALLALCATLIVASGGQFFETWRQSRDRTTVVLAAILVALLAATLLLTEHRDLSWIALICSLVASSNSLRVRRRGIAA